MMTQLEKITKALYRNNDFPGVSAKKLANVTKVPLNSVYKRIHDLREMGYTIYTNQRIVAGQSKSFYRAD